MKDRLEATAWPVPADFFGPRRPLAGIRRVLGPGLALAGLATMVLTTRHGSAGPHRPWVLADGLLIAVGFLTVIYAGPNARPPARIAMLAGLYAAAVALPMIIGEPRGLGVVAYPIVASVVLLPPLWTRAIGTVAAAAELGLSWWLLGAPAWDIVLLLAFVTFVLTGINQLSRTVNELRAARDEIAALSTAAERARVARDLHDVLGHSLTTITVKTGLARRVLESGADPERAVTEIRDAERLSRETLDEIRATVSGYRRASLTTELAGARSALRGAGIAARLPRTADDVRDDLREPFAHVLREGVTNIIRHSGASLCDVHLTRTTIEVRDDGGTSPTPDARTSRESDGSDPRGSDGLASRGSDGSASRGSEGSGPRGSDGPVSRGSGGSVPRGSDSLASRGSDGSAPRRSDGPAPAVPGTGLIGLAERLAGVGARLEAGSLPEGGFRLAAIAEEDAR